MPGGDEGPVQRRENLLGAADRVGTDRRQAIPDTQDRQATLRGETENVKRVGCFAPPIRAGDAPAERLVMQLAGMGRLAEIIFRRNAEALGREIELFEQPALRRETIDHAPLARSRSSGRSGISVGRERCGKKFAGHKTPVAAVIKRHFDDRGRGIGEAARGVDGEGGGVVVGVAALIGMREHGGRLFRAQQLRRSAATKPARSCQASLSGMPRPSLRSRAASPACNAAAKLRLSRRGVIRDAGKAIIAGVLSHRAARRR